MKKPGRSLALFLLSITFFASCQKGSNQAVSPFPITVYSYSVTPKYNMRMFVGTTEITDTVKIKKYFSTVATKLTAQSILPSFPPSYTFRTADSIQVASSSSSSFVYTNINGKQVVTITSFVPFDPTQNTFDLNKLYIYPVTAVPASGGFSLTTSIEGYGDYTSFKIPILNYKYRKPSASFTATGLINNEFNFASLSTLASTDTLAVQEFYLNYQAKTPVF